MGEFEENGIRTYQSATHYLQQAKRDMVCETPQRTLHIYIDPSEQQLSDCNDYIFIHVVDAGQTTEQPLSQYIAKSKTIVVVNKMSVCLWGMGMSDDTHQDMIGTRLAGLLRRTFRPLRGIENSQTCP